MIQKKIFFLICLVLSQLFIVCNAQKLLVSVPVADLRSGRTAVPAGLQAPAMSQDLKGQSSQVLFGEKLILNKKFFDRLTSDDWINVSALEQEVVTDNGRWIGCSGYVKKDQTMPVENFQQASIILQDLWTPIYSQKDTNTQPVISCAFGTMLEAQRLDSSWWQVFFNGQAFGFIQVTENIYELSDRVKETELELRNSIVTLAKKFIGSCYVLGGRSPTKQPQDILQITGIDCSDLINILYKAVGLQIPKNSTSQFYGVSKVIKYGKDLFPGDLLFFTRQNDVTKMCHVMLYLGKNDAGEGELLEATGRGVSSVKEALDNNIDLKDLAVRKVKLIDYLGVDIDQVESGSTFYKKRGYFVMMGSYFGSPEAIQTLRTKLISY